MVPPNTVAAQTVAVVEGVHRSVAVAVHKLAAAVSRNIPAVFVVVVADSQVVLVSSPD